MQLIKNQLTEVAEALKNHDQGLPTGLKSLDRAIRGLGKGNMIIVAGRSSMGKTALAGDMILAQTEPVLAFSLEMSSVVLIQRMISNLANVNFRSMIDGKISEKETERIRAAMRDLQHRPIYIDDTPCLTPEQFMQKCDDCPQAKLIVVDYLQLMRHEDGRLNETVALDRICQAMRGYIKDVKKPLVLVSQLSRKPDDRESHEPRMSDLRGSGGIEQTADVVLFIHRPSYYIQREIDFNVEDSGEAEIIVGKQRNGCTGKVKTIFIGQFMSFRDSKDADMGGW